jgi:hypothetical protein
MGVMCKLIDYSTSGKYGGGRGCEVKGMVRQRGEGEDRTKEGKKRQKNSWGT